MTFVMVAGGFDLSVGAIYAAGATVYAMEAKEWRYHLPLSWPWQLVSLRHAERRHRHAAQGQSFRRDARHDVDLWRCSLSYSHSAPVLVDRPDFSVLGAGRWFGVPILFVLLIWRTPSGPWCCQRRSMAVRFMPLAATPRQRVRGIASDLLKASTYALVGVLAAFGGMIIASRLSIGQADIAGTMSLDAIAIVIIGGTSLFGGSGAVWRTAVGLLLLAVLTNIFDALALDSNFQSLIKGVIVIGAVALDAFSRRL